MRALRGVALIAAALGVGCERCGYGESARPEPTDPPALAQAREELEEASDVEKEMGRPPLPSERMGWQEERAEALAEARRSLGDLDLRVAALEQRVRRNPNRNARHNLDRVRDARAALERRLGTLARADEATWGEARLQLELAMDTLTEAYAQAENAVARR